MGQAERDRYNLARGGTAGLKYLIKVGESADTARQRYEAEQAARVNAAKTGVAPAAGAGAAASSYTSAGVSAPQVAKTGPITPDAVMGEYQRAFNEAKGANEGRYGEILQGYDKMSGAYDASLNNARGIVNTLGAQEASDIRGDYSAAGATAQQRLVDQGMANTTVAPTLAAGNLRNQNADLGRLNERLGRERLGVEADFGRKSIQNYGDKMNFMERRTDAYPDYGTYADLAMRAGQGGTWGDNGGMGYPGPGGAGTGGGGYAGPSRPTISTVKGPYLSAAGGGAIGNSEPFSWTPYRDMTDQEIADAKSGALQQRYQQNYRTMGLAGSRGIRRRAA